MTLEAAATFAEFEDDPRAIQALEQALSWGRPLEHTAQRLRDARAEDTALRAHAQLLREQGVPVLNPQDVPDRAWTLQLDALVTPDGERLVWHGRMPGRIGDAPAGENGFGYDPLFIPAGLEVSSAELTPAEKDSIAHRGIAVSAFVSYLAGLES